MTRPFTTRPLLRDVTPSYRRVPLYTFIRHYYQTISAAAWLLGSRVRIPLGDVCLLCLYVVLSCLGRGLGPVSVLVIALQSSEIPEGLMNNPVCCSTFSTYFLRGNHNMESLCGNSVSPLYISQVTDTNRSFEFTKRNDVAFQEEHKYATKLQ
jgi:hypothetical protein